MNLQQLMAYGLDGFSNAAETLVGAAIGRSDMAGLKAAFKTACVWSLVVAAGFMLIFSVFGHALIHSMTNVDAVRNMAYLYLPWVIILPIVCVWGFVFDGIFVGATRSTEMRNTMIFASIFCFLPCWYFTQAMGNNGLWLSFAVYMLARGMSMGLIYIKRKERWIVAT